MGKRNVKTWKIGSGVGLGLAGMTWALAAGPTVPLAGLSGAQVQLFETGRKAFAEEEGIENGIGPVFNGRSCGECHATPSLGGSSPDLFNSVVTRFARITNGQFDPMIDFGGPVVQRRSVHELLPKISLAGEVVPPQATLHSRRITPPLFGAGLVDALPDSVILARSDPNDANHDGISGRPNWVRDTEVGRTLLGRFGWKADVARLHFFAGMAYLNELGITSVSFPNENLPQGKAIPIGADLSSDLEDDENDVGFFTAFMQGLASLPRRGAGSAVRAGEALFTQVGCAGCHVPALGKVEAFSDFLLHDMGAGLADGMVQEQASGLEWRSAPLWGLSRRLFFMHDGRARTVTDAILAHGGEATGARGRYAGLTAGARSDLIAFLQTL